MNLGAVAEKGLDDLRFAGLHGQVQRCVIVLERKKIGEGEV